MATLEEIRQQLDAVEKLVEQAESFVENTDVPTDGSNGGSPPSSPAEPPRPKNPKTSREATGEGWVVAGLGLASAAFVAVPWISSMSDDE